jgi:hypothetical protein
MQHVGLKPSEVAPLLGYKSRSSVYELVAAGLLRPIAGLKSIRISPAELERFASESKEVA